MNKHRTQQTWNIVDLITVASPMVTNFETLRFTCPDQYTFSSLTSYIHTMTELSYERKVYIVSFYRTVKSFSGLLKRNNRDLIAHAEECIGKKQDTEPDKEYKTRFYGFLKSLRQTVQPSPTFENGYSCCVSCDKKIWKNGKLQKTTRDNKYHCVIVNFADVRIVGNQYNGIVTYVTK